MLTIPTAAIGIRRSRTAAARTGFPALTPPSTQSQELFPTDLPRQTLGAHAPGERQPSPRAPGRAPAIGSTRQHAADNVPHANDRDVPLNQPVEELGELRRFGRIARRCPIVRLEVMKRNDHPATFVRADESEGNEMLGRRPAAGAVRGAQPEGILRRQALDHAADAPRPDVAHFTNDRFDLGAAFAEGVGKRNGVEAALEQSEPVGLDFPPRLAQSQRRQVRVTACVTADLVSLRDKCPQVVPAEVALASHGPAGDVEGSRESTCSEQLPREPLAGHAVVERERDDWIPESLRRRLLSAAVSTSSRQAADDPSEARAHLASLTDAYLRGDGGSRTSSRRGLRLDVGRDALTEAP